MSRISVPFLLFLTPLIFLCEPIKASEEIEHISKEEGKTIENLSEESSDMTDEEKHTLDAIWALNWQDTGIYNLSKSNSTISLPEGYKLLIGEDAKKGRALICGDQENPKLEALVYDDTFENVIVFESFQGGYVSLDDWDDLDPKSLLKNISENTEKANIERERNERALHIIGWIQEPILDKSKNIVFWAIEAESISEGTIVNSVAIVLSREGFEKIVWIAPKELYMPSGHLEVMLHSYNFDSGYRYKDFTTGDKTAGYGIAALVATTVGGKILKAGGIILLFKKLGGFFFAGIMALYYRFRNIIKGKISK